MENDDLYKRERTFRIIATVLFLCLTVRVFYFAVLRGEQLSTQASEMKRGELAVATVRGKICDRTGVPLTPSKRLAKVIINKSISEEQVKLLAKSMKIEPKILYQKLNKAERFYTVKTSMQIGRSVFEVSKTNNIQGVSVISMNVSENQEGLAQHLVGYLDEECEVGTSGLEKEFDSLLRTKNNIKVSFVQDALQQMINGTSVQLSESENIFDAYMSASYLYTTIDYRMQKTIEDVVDNEKENFKGAVVLSDVTTGEILAMVSRPNFKRDNVASLINEEEKDMMPKKKADNSALINRAVAAYPPGSIAKILDSVAWLETFGTDFSYYCTGSIVANGNNVACNAEDGHGEVNLPQAFAYSCNPFYVQLTRMLGAEVVVEMAERFGFGQTTNLTHQGVPEATGTLPLASEIYNDGDLANFSLGQGVFTATPVQVNAMMATIANGGVYCEPTILKSVNKAGGHLVRSFKTGVKRRVISEGVSSSLRAFCEGTVNYGTGRFAKINTEKIDGVAGKTGTAEVSGAKSHAWFSGYFPVSSPKYAMTILWENGEHGGSVAGTLFKKICKEINF